MKIYAPISILILTLITACATSAGGQPASPSLPPADTPSAFPATQTFTPLPPFTFTPLPTDTPAPTATATLTPIPTIESLRAAVTADKLSCRYGPGAEYLYLLAFNKTARIKLVGRADANAWVWVANVDNQNRSANCWVNNKFLEIQGDPQTLPIVYPGLKLPVSPYYPGPSWANAERDKDGKVVITWEAVPISPGKYEDENMHQYIVEVWRCEAGQIIFETLGTNYPAITVDVDEAGCAIPSHGRVFVQEKHGYGGPVEIPWPSP
ncbi:MAG: hypothetical protein IT314_15650 [Anaerolineales bacterium]|nr:hypothetical protein [Anaerolineales bacterium]